MGQLDAPESERSVGLPPGPVRTLSECWKFDNIAIICL
jgi:hypothetical protein